LEGLAQRYRTSPNLLAQNNCLLTSSLPVGFVIYVPPLPLPTATPCRPPRGWVVYIIQPGDTLSKIAARYGIRYPELQAANCLTSTILYAGQPLYVPPWPPFTSTPNLTLTPSPTTTTTASETPTSTPSATPATPSPTATTEPPPTSTPTPSNTPTETPSSTPTTPSP
ncbi:MAG: LysM peptidoglycan-binding domain-containing protein, partial [Anaerolineales bacterium]